MIFSPGTYPFFEEYSERYLPYFRHPRDMTTVFERTLCNGVASHLSYGRIYGCRPARGARTATSAADTSHHAVGGHILHTVLATTLVSKGRNTQGLVSLPDYTVGYTVT